MSTTVSSGHESRSRSSTAWRTAGMVPVRCRMPNTPPMMKMKKMMSAGLDHAAGDGAQEALQAHRAGEAIPWVAEHQPLAGQMLRNLLVGAGDQNRPLGAADLHGLACELSRGHDEGQQAAREDHARQKGENVRDPPPSGCAAQKELLFSLIFRFGKRHRPSNQARGLAGFRIRKSELITSHSVFTHDF